MKRRKLKKKVLIIGIIILIVILGLILTPFILQKQEENLKKKIENHYQEVMKVIKDTTFVQEIEGKWIDAGMFYQDTIVTLESIKNEYYKLKDNDYYIHYKALEKAENKVENINNYLLFNENARVSKNATFYQNDKKVFRFNETLTLPIIEKLENSYKVKIQNNIFEVKKEDVEEIIVAENKTETPLEKISILFFEDENNIEEKLKNLQEKGYNFITEAELIQFLNGNILLKENTAMLIFDEESENIKNFIETYNLVVNYSKNLTLTYKEGDSQVSSLNNLTKYKITKDTSLTRFEQMLEGITEIKDKATSIAVLNYHFFYDDTKEVCSESICSKTKDFEEQLKYLKDNGFRTLTMQEFYDWYIGKIELPKKSVLITVDDGAFGTDTHLPNLLEKYDAKATLFLISGWWPTTKYRLGNLELQSHTHDLHHNNFVRDEKKGIKTLMLTKEELLADLRLSKETLNNPIAFCYPFYAYNDTLISAVKEEFLIAFAGGNRKATRSSDAYKIPRYPIYKTTSLSTFKNMVN